MHSYQFALTLPRAMQLLGVPMVPLFNPPLPLSTQGGVGTLKWPWKATSLDVS